MPPDQSHTSLTAEQHLYAALALIPYGTVTSYGRLAAMAGYPGRARWVGKVLSQLPPNSQLPWYRVINAQGNISFPSDSDAAIRQCTRLLEEGIKVRNGKKVLAKLI
ncbi:MGMT family protein [Thalassolituus sp.]|jgi:methylated-DNA-protein-cysteine methyltransferase-like protein|uniref:MGMT family protein n=1 Tax=Thalassolituus sp. TaxID=2030822 RepID=UPI002A7EC97A|nr:MGMT family protein [Thalassolituus sp.]|tara:strand:- start:6681 stop:7001 length:321 start_codon:yes stop_codon:yes gene_type:complete